MTKKENKNILEELESQDIELSDDNEQIEESKSKKENKEPKEEKKKEMKVQDLPGVGGASTSDRCRDGRRIRHLEGDA